MSRWINLTKRALGSDYISANIMVELYDSKGVLLRKKGDRHIVGLANCEIRELAKMAGLKAVEK